MQSCTRKIENVATAANKGRYQGAALLFTLHYSLSFVFLKPGSATPPERLVRHAARA